MAWGRQEWNKIASTLANVQKAPAERMKQMT
jgi:hypothetical protein